MSPARLRLLLALAAASPLIAWYAGGWATVTVENLPDYLVAGQATNMTFSVRQHGVELLSDLKPTVTARSGNHEFEARAVQTNRRGYYTVTLNAPRAGDWKFTIHSGFRAGNHESKLTLLPIRALTSAARPVAFSHEQRGIRLFVAKGCVICHMHSQVEGSGELDFGGDLTGRRFPAEYLAQFLANPTVKMPNLNLKPGEIASLIAFINKSDAS
ncbi:MAG: hypothetical protein ACT4O1_13150 [Gemmatimonadota bacterium]